MEEKEAIEHVHFLVHPAYSHTLYDRPGEAPEILRAYAKKINAISKNPNTHLRIILPFEDRRANSPQLGWLEELAGHAERQMPGRVEFSHEEADEAELSSLKRKLADGARLHFWGEYFGNCVHTQALRSAYALGVKPEEADERLDFNRAHSVKQGKSPLYLKTFGNRKEHSEAKRPVEENAAQIKRSFNNTYEEYYRRRKKGEPHEKIISDFCLRMLRRKH